MKLCGYYNIAIMLRIFVIHIYYLGLLSYWHVSGVKATSIRANENINISLSEDWTSELSSYAKKCVYENVTVEQLLLRGHFEGGTNICVRDALNNFGQKTVGQEKWTNRRAIDAGQTFLPGTTYYIDEFMAVGHMMYDIQVLMLLNATRIDRIILQRAPCATNDLCTGTGTWLSFFKNFYNILLKTVGGHSFTNMLEGNATASKTLATLSQTLIYLRYYPSDTAWLARPLHELSITPNPLKNVNQPNQSTEHRALAVPTAQMIPKGFQISRFKESNHAPPERHMSQTSAGKHSHSSIPSTSTQVSAPYAAEQIAEAPIIKTASVLCFERAFHRGKNRNFYNSINPMLTHKFKAVAYREAEVLFPKYSSQTRQMVKPQSNAPLTSPENREATVEYAPIGLLDRKQVVITIATRGKAHYRELSDPTVLQKHLIELLPSIIHMNVSVVIFDTTHATHKMQMQTVASTDILICTHGGFEANAIYMRPHTLLIEIRGSGHPNYDDNATNYNHLANMFHVHFRSMAVQGLKGMRDKVYELSTIEFKRIMDFIQGYVTYVGTL